MKLSEFEIVTVPLEKVDQIIESTKRDNPDFDKRLEQVKATFEPS